MRLHFVIGPVYTESAKERLKQRSGVPRLADSALTCRIANCDLHPMQHSSKLRGSEDICVALLLQLNPFLLLDSIRKYQLRWQPHMDLCAIAERASMCLLRCFDPYCRSCIPYMWRSKPVNSLVAKSCCFARLGSSGMARRSWQMPVV